MDHRRDTAELVYRINRDDALRGSGHADGHDIALLKTRRGEGIGEFVDVGAKLFIGLGCYREIPGRLSCIFLDLLHQLLV